ncbi:VOC family protein [Nocardiopsis eucommiae]|uniref:VOC family protein n=1 Tax=Nocardiopsis eucommiae TaxID=2831970 RepID=UPI003D75272A
MLVDSITLQADDPPTLARFWSEALRVPIVRGEPAGLLLATPGVPLRLIPAPSTSRSEPAITRLHLDLSGGSDHRSWARTLCSLGASPRDVGQGDVPWEVLADVEGNLFCVMPGDRYEEAGPGLGSLPVDSARPRADRDFWARITGWTPTEKGHPELRPPHGLGIRLAFCDELGPKPANEPNLMGPALRLEEHERETDALELLVHAGAVRVETEDEAPWHLLADPSGNEFRLLKPLR